MPYAKTRGIRHSSMVAYPLTLGPLDHAWGLNRAQLSMALRPELKRASRFSIASAECAYRHRRTTQAAIDRLVAGRSATAQPIMSRPCTSCQHLKRPEIDRRLAAGEPVAQMARDHDLNLSSLHRHRTNCLKLASFQPNQERGYVRFLNLNW